MNYKKIVFVTEYLDIIDGIARVITNWSNYFVKYGIDIENVCVRNGKPFFKLDERVKFKKITKYSLIASILIIGLIYVFKSQIVYFLNGFQNQTIENIIFLLSFIIPLGFISSMFSHCIMMVNGDHKWIAFSGLFAILGGGIIFF